MSYLFKSKCKSFSYYSGWFKSKCKSWFDPFGFKLKWLSNYFGCRWLSDQYISSEMIVFAIFSRAALTFISCFTCFSRSGFTSTSCFVLAQFVPGAPKQSKNWGLTTEKIPVLIGEGLGTGLLVCVFPPLTPGSFENSTWRYFPNFLGDASDVTVVLDAYFFGNISSRYVAGGTDP